MELPRLYEELLRASKITNYMCPSTEATSSSRLSEKSTSAPRAVGRSSLHQHSVATRVLTPPFQSDDASTTESCDSDTCESSGAENDISESWWKNPMAKSSKM